MKCLLFVFQVTLGLATASCFGLPLQDKQGNTAEVEVLSATSSEAVVLLNGMRRTIKLDSLAPDSAAAVVAEAKQKGAYQSFPPLDVQVTVGTSRRAHGTSGYMKAMTISPSVLIAGRSRMEPIPEAEATMVIICMDMRKFATRKANYEVGLVDSKRIPAAPDGTRRKIEFETMQTVYDADRDTSNLGGSVYKYYAFVLTDPEDGAVVYFDTNWADLKKLADDDKEVPRKVARLTKGKKMVEAPEL